MKQCHPAEEVEGTERGLRGDGYSTSGLLASPPHHLERLYSKDFYSSPLSHNTHTHALFILYYIAFTWVLKFALLFFFSFLARLIYIYIHII